MLAVPQLVKKFSAFYGTQMSITHVHKPNPLVPLLSQINPVQILTSMFFKIHFHIILLLTPWVFQVALSFRIPHQNPVYASTLPYTRYMPRPSHSSRFDHPNDIWCWVQVTKLLPMQFSPIPSYLLPLKTPLQCKLIFGNISETVRATKETTTTYTQYWVYLRFLVLAVGIVKGPSFCVLTPRSAVGRHRRFGIPPCLNIQ